MKKHDECSSCSDNIRSMPCASIEFCVICGKMVCRHSVDYPICPDCAVARALAEMKTQRQSDLGTYFSVE